MTFTKNSLFRIGEKKFLIYFFIIAIVFSDILGNANLNLLYFLGAYLIIHNLKLRVSFLKDVIIYFLPFCVMVIGEILFSGNIFLFKKVIVYSLKILACISLLSYVKNKFWRIDYLKVINYICQIFKIMLIISLLTVKFPIFWRLNDPYNNFSKTRLKFLYSEPSALGVLCGFILIILMYHFFNKIQNHAILKKIILLMIIIFFTFSMSGIAYTFIAIIVLFFCFFFKDIRRIPQKLLIYFIVFLWISTMILITSNPISERFFSMFLGLDGSYNFRWTAAVKVFSKTMEITKNWGIGIGNMNTPIGLSFFQSLKINYKLANSFLYFFTENGFLGIIYTFYLLILCIYSCIKSSNIIRPLKVSLLFFVFISQIAGGYFTDPILWIIYGIVCSREVNL